MVAVLGAAALSTLMFLVTMVPVFSLGVIVAEFIVALGWMNKIAWITQPLTRLGHLKPECGASFLTAFLSPSAGNAMLVRHHEAGRITRKELIIAAIVNTFPGIVMHWRTVLPVAIPLIGIYAFVYYGFLLLVGLLKTIRDLRPTYRMAGAGCFNGIEDGDHGYPDLDFVCNLDLRITTDLLKIQKGPRTPWRRPLCPGRDHGPDRRFRQRA